MDNIALDLLGLRLTLKLPRISLKGEDQGEDQGADYHLQIQENHNFNDEGEDEKKMSYLEWKYGDKMTKMVYETMATPETQKVVAKMRELPKLKSSLLRTHQFQHQDLIAVDDERRHLLRKDSRVINRLMTVEQLSHIQKWLENQPDEFDVEKVQEESHYEKVDNDDRDDEDVSEDVQDSQHFMTNYYTRRDRLVYYRKVSIV